jgi:hypothetical protein
MRQFLPTGRLRRRNAFSSTGNSLTAPAVHGRIPQGNFVRGVIDRNAAPSHHVFEVPQAQRVGHVPAHASQDHIERIVQAFEHSGHRRIQRLHRAFSRSRRSARHSGAPYCDRTSRTPQRTDLPAASAVSFIRSHLDTTVSSISHFPFLTRYMVVAAAFNAPVLSNSMRPVTPWYLIARSFGR